MERITDRLRSFRHDDGNSEPPMRSAVIIRMSGACLPISMSYVF